MREAETARLGRLLDPEASQSAAAAVPGAVRVRSNLRPRGRSRPLIIQSGPQGFGAVTGGCAKGVSGGSGVGGAAGVAAACNCW